MTGQELKEKLLSVNVPFNEIAERLGITAQSLNSCFKGKDVRSNTIERIASVLGVDMSFFYPAEDVGQNAMASGNGIAVAGNNNVVGNVEMEPQSLALPKSLPFIKYEHLTDLHFPLDPEGKYDGAHATSKFIESRAQFVTEYRQLDAMPYIPPGSSIACKTISKDDVIDKALCLLILRGNPIIRRVSSGHDKEHYHITYVKDENTIKELPKSEVISIHCIMAYLVTYP